MALRLLDAVPMATDTGIRTMGTVDALMTIPPATIGEMEAIPVAVVQTVSDDTTDNFGERSHAQIMQSFQIQLEVVRPDL